MRNQRINVNRMETLTNPIFHHPLIALTRGHRGVEKKDWIDSLPLYPSVSSSDQRERVVETYSILFGCGYAVLGILWFNQPEAER